MQDRESISINSGDTSVSRSRQLETVVPVSTISSLSAGEFVGMVADNPDQTIELKTFHARVINDHETLNKQKTNCISIPPVRKIDNMIIESNYKIVKQEVQDIIDLVMDQVLNDASRQHLVVKRR